MKQLDSSKQLLFVGDNHGNWHNLLDDIQSKNISDAYIISVGDLGMGFNPTRDLHTCEALNREFFARNNTFYGIRGNHDNPVYFSGNKRIVYSNFELIEDYSVFEYKTKLLKFIGGAISLDRTSRRAGISFWENEGVHFDRDKCRKVDVLITHTAPSRCFPQTFNEMVLGWAREDAYLLEELTDERAVMDEIFKICNPTLHLYGHFHSSHTENINNCTHKLLNIDEIWEGAF